MGKRLLVVPGYVFSMKNEWGAEKVPDAEWKVIEAISDSHTSTLDVKEKKITDGPLKGLLILRINPSLRSVCIRAKLLGVTRDYWLAVRFASSTSSPSTEEKKDDAEEKKDDAEEKVAEQARPVVELENSKAEEGKKMDYTQEQIDEILKRAEEVGIHQSACEYSVPWQKVQGWAKKAGVMDKVSKKPAKKTASSKPAAEDKKTRTKKAKTTEPVMEEKTESVVEKKPAKRTRKVKEAEPVVAEKKAAEEQPTSALEIENAVLKAENEQLKAKIEKLQKALAELM